MEKPFHSSLRFVMHRVHAHVSGFSYTSRSAQREDDAMQVAPFLHGLGSANVSIRAAVPDLSTHSKFPSGNPDRNRIQPLLKSASSMHLPELLDDWCAP